MAIKFKDKEIQDRFENISPEFKYIMFKRQNIAKQISLLLKQKGITQRELAETLNKSESEISKWISGTHNLTSDTIALIEFHLERNGIIICPKDIKQNEYNLMIFPGSNAILVKSKGEVTKESNTLSLSVQAGSGPIPEDCFVLGN